MRKIFPWLALLLLVACQKEPWYPWHNQHFEVLSYEIASYQDGKFSRYFTTCDTTYDCSGSLHFDEQASIAWLVMTESTAVMTTNRNFSQQYSTNRRGELFFLGRPVQVTQFGSDTLHLDWETEYEWHQSLWHQTYHLEIARKKAE